MHRPPVFPDAFAIEWGHDKFGTFQSFAVENVVQRMRWIPPGTFMMGSSENEVGRYNDENLHRVELTRGYWLADTPVTQALWEVVMGSNPSLNKNLSCPIDTVSWDDCQEFMKRVNNCGVCLDMRLPTEAEWEYACRAGTTAATWLGDLQSGEKGDALLLDSIAWYSGNAESTTHPVGQKLANPWGLYDMLGNVYEWCADWYGDYDMKIVRDPQGPADGAERVLRGRSWGSYARYVRADFRLGTLPNKRLDHVGFRLARSATVATP